MTIRGLLASGVDIDAPLYHEDDVSIWPVGSGRAATTDDRRTHRELYRDEFGSAYQPIPKRAVMLQ